MRINAANVLNYKGTSDGRGFFGNYAGEEKSLRGIDAVN